MKKRIVSLTLCLLFVMTALCGCVNDSESAGIELLCHAMVNALATGNADAGWEVVDPQYCTREEFDAFFASAAPELAGLDSFELKQTGWHTEITNGIRVVELTYMVLDGEKICCYVTAMKIDDGEKLAGINVQWPQEGASTDDIKIAAIVLLVILGGIGLFVIAAVVVVIVLVVHFRKKKAREAELNRIHEMSNVFDTVNKDEQ